MILSQLQNGSVEAWTYLIRTRQELLEETVLHVDVEEVDLRQTRYSLTLSSQSEPIDLLLKSTSRSELAFYQKFAQSFRALVPRCWTTFDEDFSADRGWAILEDTANHYAPSTWAKRDLVKVMGHLANLHAQYWDQGVMLSSYLIPHIVYSPKLSSHLTDSDSPDQPIADNNPFNQQTSLATARLRYSTKRLDQLFRATAGLRILKDQADQLGIVHEGHLEALEDLLINPSFLIEPLRAIPITLLHGRPSASQWSINLLEEFRLHDWRRVTAGPNVFDLADFVENYVVWHTLKVDSHPEVNGSLEELLLDSYFLALNGRMRDLRGDEVTVATRYLRRVAYPAAVCWQMLTRWLPKFLNGFEQELIDGRSRQSNSANNRLFTQDIWENESFKLAMSHTFNRFLDAYKLLQSNPIETYEL